jgi:hypothetical protein
VVRYSVAYDPEEMRHACCEMLREAGVRVLFHSWACEPLVEDGRVGAVAFQGKSGRFAVRARAVVDATGDGDLFAAAGCAHEKEQVLPWLWFTVGGVEDAEAAAASGSGGFVTIGEGRLLMPWGATPKLTRRIDATSPEDLSYAELACRARVMGSSIGCGARSPAPPARICVGSPSSWASPRAGGCWVGACSRATTWTRASPTASR